MHEIRTCCTGSGVLSTHLLHTVRCAQYAPAAHGPVCSVRTCCTRPGVHADADHEWGVGHVVNLEDGDGAADGQRHVGDVRNVLVAVAVRNAADAHVRVTNRFNLQRTNAVADGGKLCLNLVDDLFDGSLDV